jgi:predicted ribosome quality control (RQC) complex YloA/Tae2 family protein
VASKGRAFRELRIQGFTVLVGKGDAENDALTFGSGEPRDFWMHVAGCPGSHVVVKNPDDLRDLPRGVLEEAAAIAAWHSKARGARGKIEVHVCRVGDVSKPRGFARGEVRLRRWDSVRVYAREVPTDDTAAPT